MSRRNPRYDRRLFGTWKSDRRRTFRDGIPQIVPEDKRAFYRNIFGKLTVHWGRNRYWSNYAGYRDRGRYEVLRIEGPDLLLQYWNGPEGGPQLHRIHFEGKYRYWLELDNGTREYFRRCRAGSDRRRFNLLTPFAVALRSKRAGS